MKPRSMSKALEAERDALAEKLAIAVGRLVQIKAGVASPISLASATIAALEDKKDA